MLAVHDPTGWAGRRDHALLLTLYNTGARVSEITGLQRSHVKFGIKSFVQFIGKGGKNEPCRFGRQLPECYRPGSRSWNRINATQPWPFPTPAERRSVGMESTFFFRNTRGALS